MKSKQETEVSTLYSASMTELSNTSKKASQKEVNAGGSVGLFTRTRYVFRWFTFSCL